MGISMTDYEFTQIMRDAGYEVSAGSSTSWEYKKNTTFKVDEWKGILGSDEVWVRLPITSRESDVILYNFEYTFENVSKMNSIEFKKKLEGITEYAYSLYMDINRHIDALSKKMETKANRLGM